MTQTYRNHRRFFPLYHFFVVPILIANMIWQLWRLSYGISVDSVMAAATGVALVGLGLAARTMALRVQDRVIRLEMRLRLREVLPAPLAGRIRELSRAQLVGLRFASDAELPSLVQQVLDQGIASSTAIKKLIKAWEADHLRA